MSLDLALPILFASRISASDSMHDTASSTTRKPELNWKSSTTAWPADTTPSCDTMPSRDTVPPWDTIGDAALQQRVDDLRELGEVGKRPAVHVDGDVRPTRMEAMVNVVRQHCAEHHKLLVAALFELGLFAQLRNSATQHTAYMRHTRHARGMHAACTQHTRGMHAAYNVQHATAWQCSVWTRCSTLKPFPDRRRSCVSAHAQPFVRCVCVCVCVCVCARACVYVQDSNANMGPER